jgi:hypothetical protein
MGNSTGLIRGVAAALCLVWVVAACDRSPPEVRLREALGELQAVVERRDAAALDEVLAEDFIGPDSLDRAGARRMAQLMFLRYGAVGASTGPVSIDLQPGHATARFSVALTGGSGQVLPDAARLYDVTTGWREVDGEWRMTSASWEGKL